MTSLASTIDLLHLFGDPTRVRLAALLAREELTVAELTAITDLAQSRVSTHLGKLREAGVLRDRRDGSSTYYSLDEEGMPAEVKRIWSLVRDEVKDSLLESDRARSAEVVRARRGPSWPERVAGQMERHYSPGRTWESMARGLLGLLELGDVLDAGCGDGTIAELIAPRARSVTCADVNDKVLAAAHERLARFDNVRTARADVQQLPFAAASFDQVLLFNVLCHVDSPPRAIADAARVLRPGGRLAIVTLAPHDHLEDVAAAFGHVNAGCSPRQLERWIQKAGLAVDRCEVAARERRAPYFDVVTAFATRIRNGK